MGCEKRSPLLSLNIVNDLDFWDFLRLAGERLCLLLSGFSCFRPCLQVCCELFLVLFSVFEKLHSFHGQEKPF